MSKPAVLMSYAFRPFFLLSALAAVLGIGLWILVLHGVPVPILGSNALRWHAHEMLVGFVMATIAGFVLTAVSTWTGRKPVSGRPLLMLVVFWVLGRGAMVFGGSLPCWAAGTLDMLFPVFLSFLVCREIFAAGSQRNYPIAAITALLVLLNLGYHLGASGIFPGLERVMLYAFVHTILLLVTIVGGRVLPNFTANWMRQRGLTALPSNNPTVDRMTVVATLALGVVGSLSPTGTASGVLAVAASLLHAWRVSQWRGLATLREPLLCVLHLSYLWLPIGYGLLAIAILAGTGAASAALHVLTMGGIGGMILSMITRVPLGHTGRNLHASRLTVLAYLLLIGAVVIRAASPLPGLRYLDSLAIAAIAWCAAFVIFLLVYWPVMTRPRVDQPGPS